MLNWARKSEVGPTSKAMLFDAFAGTASITPVQQGDASLD